jgi:hypothetical protein
MFWRKKKAAEPVVRIVFGTVTPVGTIFENSPDGTGNMLAVTVTRNSVVRLSSWRARIELSTGEEVEVIIEDFDNRPQNPQAGIGTMDLRKIRELTSVGKLKAMFVRDSSGRDWHAPRDNYEHACELARAALPCLEASAAQP